MGKTSSWAGAKRIFSEALDLPLEQRDAFLASACGEEEALLSEVRSLLSWHVQSTGFLEQPAARLGGLSPTTTRYPDLVGTTIGAWRVESLVGSGGMGIVYRAERADAAFRRQVALKVIRPGSDRRRHRAPVPERARDAGRAGPSEHCAAARRRHHTPTASRTW